MGDIQIYPDSVTALQAYAPVLASIGADSSPGTTPDDPTDSEDSNKPLLCHEESAGKFNDAYLRYSPYLELAFAVAYASQIGRYPIPSQENYTISIDGEETDIPKRLIHRSIVPLLGMSIINVTDPIAGIAQVGCEYSRHRDTRNSEDQEVKKQDAGASYRLRPKNTDWDNIDWARVIVEGTAIGVDAYALWRAQELVNSPHTPLLNDPYKILKWGAIGNFAASTLGLGLTFTLDF